MLTKLISENKEINFDFYGLNNKQPIWGDEFKLKLSNSKMGLNFSKANLLNIIVVIE